MCDIFVWLCAILRDFADRFDDAMIDPPEEDGAEDHRHNLRNGEGEPDGVAYGVLLEVCLNGLAEGPERKVCHLDALKTKRNTNESNAEKTAKEKECDRLPKAEEKEPDDVSKCFHTNDTSHRFIKGWRCSRSLGLF